MKSLLKNNSIEIYSAQHERNTYVTSRFIRSLKEKIHIYIYIYIYIINQKFYIKNQHRIIFIVLKY